MRGTENKYIVLLVGKSGTGKSTVEKILVEQYGYKAVKSYTTRKPRYDGEDTHIFATDEDYEKMKDDICAFTEFDGYKYWATNEQVDKADVYIVDPAGIKYFKNNYRGDKKIITVELLAQKSTRYKRMRERGDSIYKAYKRLRHDRKVFANCITNFKVNANSASSKLVACDVMELVEWRKRYLNGVFK